MANNEITLGDNQPLSNDLKPIKVGGEASIINVSSPTPDGSVDGELEVKGKLKAKDTFIQGNLKAFSDSDTTPAFMFETKQGVNCMLRVQSAANTRTALMLKNSQGYFELRRDSSTTSLKFTDGTNTPLILDGDNVEFTNLTDGSITIDSFVDEDNMSSNSATKIPTQQSVKAYVDNEVAGLVDSAPAALDTLNELAAALNDDASFSTTVTNSLATKLNLSGGTMTGALTMNGSTGSMLHINNTGDVAILAVESQGTGSNGRSLVKFNTNGGDWEIGARNSNGSPDNSFYIYENDDTAYRFVIADGGNVGIGTTSPDSILDIRGTNPSIILAEGDDRFLSFNVDVPSDDVHTISVDQADALAFGEKLKADDTSLENEWVRITNAGNVGIGTTSPSTKLHVAGSFKATGVADFDDRVDINETSFPQLTFSDDGGTDILNMGQSGEAFYFKTSDTANNIRFRRSDNEDLLELDMSALRVGINTTSPTTTLDVEGTVSYKHISLTDSSDDLDVSGCTIVECTPSGTDYLGGLTGGVQGQILHILKVDSGLGRIIIQHNEGTGNQDIFLSGASDVMLSARGGMTLYCNGTSWFALDK